MKDILRRNEFVSSVRDLFLRNCIPISKTADSSDQHIYEN